MKLSPDIKALVGADQRGLSVAGLAVLRLLEDQRALYQQQVVDVLEIPLGTMSSMVKKMKAQGLINRRVQREARLKYQRGRPLSVQLSLAPQGQRLLDLLRTPAPPTDPGSGCRRASVAEARRQGRDREREYIYSFPPFAPLPGLRPLLARVAALRAQSGLHRVGSLGKKDQ